MSDVNHTGAAVVLGASGGLGSAVADVFEKNGWIVTRVTRAECDLASPEAVKRWLAGVGEQTIDLCICCAGISEVGRLDHLPVEAFRHCFEVNFFAPLAILLGLSRRSPQPCKSFVVVHSGTAHLLLPELAPYSLSKRALRDILYVRRLEGSLAEVAVLEVWPGPMATPFNDKTVKHADVHLPAPQRPRPPDVVARAIYRAVTAPLPAHPFLVTGGGWPRSGAGPNPVSLAPSPCRQAGPQSQARLRRSHTSKGIARMGIHQPAPPALLGRTVHLSVKLAVATLLMVQLGVAFKNVHLDFCTGQRLYYHDTVVMFVNMHLGYQSLLHGQVPTWNPDINGGEPIWPLVESVPTADPIALVCWTACYRLGQPSLLAFQWTSILWLMAFSVGGALCARQVGRNNWVAFAVFVVLLCGPLGLAASAESSGFIAPFRYLPWNILAFVHFERRPSVGRACLWGLSNALALAGYQTGYAWLFQGLFLLAYLGTRARLRRAWSGRLFPLSGVAVLCGLLGGLPTLVAGIKLLEMVPIAHLYTPGLCYVYPASLFVAFLAFPNVPLNRWHGSADVGAACAATLLLALAWFAFGPFLSRLARENRAAHASAPSAASRTSSEPGWSRASAP